MASSPEDDTRRAEEDFQKVIAQIGGKERIYLVSNDFRAEQGGGGGEAGLLQEFVRSMFPVEPPDSNLVANGPSPKQQPPAAGGGGADHPLGENCVCHVGAVVLEKALEDKDKAGSEEVEEVEEVVPAVVSTRPTDLALRAVPAAAAGGEKEVQRSVTAATTSVNLCSQRRTIDCPIIVFLFRQEFLLQGGPGSSSTVREILKDVRSRTERSAPPGPALLGLIRPAAAEDSAETADCVGVLERLIRSVFTKHSPESIWVGSFTPKTESRILAIKTNVCKVFYSRQISDDTGDRGNMVCWPFQCFSWALPGQPHSPSNKRQRGETGTIEEGIPLRADSLSPGPVDGGAVDSAAVDGAAVDGAAVDSDS